MGEPERFVLVEMGPGDGTLMDDLLRAGRALPGFLEAADVWLVEVSGPLAALQAAKLGDRVRWATSLDEVPGGEPMLLENVDSLVLCQGHQPLDSLATELQGLVEFQRIGDCLAPRSAEEAVYEGMMAGLAV